MRAGIEASYIKELIMQNHVYSKIQNEFHVELSYLFEH